MNTEIGQKNLEGVEILKDVKILLNKLLALNDKDLKYGWIFPLRHRIEEYLSKINIIDKLNE